MMTTKHKQHENGVALLFALGLLSLMSVLGVAFVTNSLMTQKTAANQGARAQAQIYLDSAINRIMISIMGVYCRDDYSPGDFANIYTTDNNGAGRTPSSALNTKDQLTDEAASKLNVFIPKQPEHKGSKMKAVWSYIRDANGKVVARVAYQVLPEDGSGVSLDKVLLGIYNHDENDAANFGYPERSGSPTSWNTRIGKDISEFNLGFASGADAPFKSEWKYGTTGDYAGAQFPENIYTGSGYSKKSPFCAVPSFEDFFSGVMYTNVIKSDNPDTDAKQQLWFKRWFTDAKDPVPEVFYRGEDGKELAATPYHRFNVGKLSSAGADEWYRRLKGFPADGSDEDKKAYRNSTAALNDLINRDASRYVVDVAPEKGGLPYLRMIGKETRSFASLELRRRQIAANLNDYCDSDDIPTSDAAPEKWGTEVVLPNGTKTLLTPGFTGNEQTPYINELALALKIKPTVAMTSWPSVDKGALSSATTIVSINAADFEPQLMVELIKIYKEIKGANYKLKTWLDKISFGLDAAFTMDVTCNFTDTEKTPLAFSFTSNAFSSAATPSGEYVFEPESGKLSLEGVTNVAADFTRGYRVHTVSYKSQVAANTFKAPANLLTLRVGDTVSYRLGSELTAAGVTLSEISTLSIKLTKIDLKVKDIKFNLRAAGLFNDNGGADYVNITYGDIAPTGAGILPMDIESNAIKVPVSPFDWNVVYVTGMAVRDPRQNLNFARPASGASFQVARTDWKCTPLIQTRTDVVDNLFGTIRIAENGTVEGVVNTCSNPSAPFDSVDRFTTSGDGRGTPGEDYDQEKVTDPAWNSVTNKGMSTAYIRNAPMSTLWELGAIHRASAWETINLKRGVNKDGKRVRGDDNYYPGSLVSPGLPYINGDGLLLDQVKLTENVKSSGKLDVNMLLTSSPDPNFPSAWDKYIFKALYNNIVLGNEIGDLYTTPVTAAVGGRKLTHSDVSDAVISKMKEQPKGHDSKNPDPNRYSSRVDFLEGPADPSGTPPADIPANAFGIDTNWGSKADAQQEELIGKTINLLTAGKSTPSTVYAVVIVQTIRGVAADGTNKVTLLRPTFKKDGSVIDPVPSFEKASNDFAVSSFTDTDGKENYIYFDEITSELRALVTFKIIESSDLAKRVQLYNVQYY